MYIELRMEGDCELYIVHLAPMTWNNCIDTLHKNQQLLMYKPMWILSQLESGRVSSCSLEWTTLSDFGVNHTAFDSPLGHSCKEPSSGYTNKMLLKGGGGGGGGSPLKFWKTQFRDNG